MPEPLLSPPGERPVVEPAAAALVDEVGGLPETLSFFATFFFAFFALVFTVVSSVATVVSRVNWVRSGFAAIIQEVIRG